MRLTHLATAAKRKAAGGSPAKRLTRLASANKQGKHSQKQDQNGLTSLRLLRSASAYTGMTRFEGFREDNGVRRLTSLATASKRVPRQAASASEMSALAGIRRRIALGLV